MVKYLTKPRFGIPCAALWWLSGAATMNHDWGYGLFFFIAGPVAQVCLDILAEDRDARAE